VERAVPAMRLAAKQPSRGRMLLPEHEVKLGEYVVERCRAKFHAVAPAPPAEALIISSISSRS
jgi:hypothetical protein